MLALFTSVRITSTGTLESSCPVPAAASPWNSSRQSTAAWMEAEMGAIAACKRKSHQTAVSLTIEHMESGARRQRQLPVQSSPKYHARLQRLLRQGAPLWHPSAQPSNQHLPFRRSPPGQHSSQECYQLDAQAATKRDSEEATPLVTWRAPHLRSESEKNRKSQER
jgi:hypothetical protein